MRALKEMTAKLRDGKYPKYALLVLLLGALLLVLPRRTAQTSAAAPETKETQLVPPAFDLEEQEARLGEALSSIAGAGRAQVVLSVHGGVARELASENGGTLIVSAGSGTQAPVELRYIYPEYQGALVICEGADDPQVCLAVTRAVRAVTGLGADRITVARMA